MVRTGVPSMRDSNTIGWRGDDMDIVVRCGLSICRACWYRKSTLNAMGGGLLCPDLA